MVGHTFIDVQGWPRRQRLQVDLQTLSDRNAALGQHVHKLAAEATALEGSKQAQEHAIRDELGWVRGPHDLVIDFDAQPGG